MAWHPIWRGTRKLVDALDRRAETRAATPRRQACLWGLQQLDLFRCVPAAELEQLVDPPQLSTYARRDVVVIEDADVHVVMRGGIKLARVGMSGRKLIVALLGGGDIFGRISAADVDESYVLEALEDAVVLTLPRDRFEPLLARKEVAYQVVQMLEEQQRELVRRVESLAFKDVRTRLIETLLALATEYPESCAHGMAVDVRITQQDLADLIGASRQMVNKLLGQLSRQLYVRRMGRVLCILNRRRLERLVAPVSTG